MFIVEITNNGQSTVVHGLAEKLKDGKIVKGINAIDSFTFTMWIDNAGFYAINEFTTTVTVYNTTKERYDFIGRVLYAETAMSEDGMITKQVTCESIAGYLCDSYQDYVDTQNWTVTGLLQHLIDCHNTQVEDYKKFQIGTVEVTDSNDNVYIGIQYENTWDSINEKLLDKLGGEFQFRVENGVNYIDYLEKIGEEKTTPIALSKNMKSITREQNPTSYVTRLIPLGAKRNKRVEKVDDNGNVVKDDSGNIVYEDVVTEQRIKLTTSVFSPYDKDYIDDEDAIALYGIHVGIVIWDGVSMADELYRVGEAWLAEQNKVPTKYSIGYLDLSLLGIDPDSVEIGNTYPIQNVLIGVDDTARVIKHTIDVCEETKSTIEVGDSLKSLSDIQREQAAALKQAEQTASQMQTDMANMNTSGSANFTAAINAKAAELTEDYTSMIEQLSDSITLEISGSLGSEASIILSAGANERSYELDLSQVRQAFANDSTAVSISAGLITFNAGTLIINSSKFTLDASGGITATDAVIYGDIITVDGKYMTEMDKGSLRLYYDDILCGTINTKYWSNASSQGISLRAEEGGKYIMFSHADDTQGSGYTVDYYLNAGWSTNYDEMHIFQTSARFLDDAYFAGKTRIRSLRLFDANGEYLVGINNGQLSVSKL